MKKICFWSLAALAAGLALAAAVPALADTVHAPIPKALGLPEAMSPFGERINEFHTLLLWIITAITVFVMILLLIVAVRFNEKANPKPAQFTHHIGLEIAWTLIPVIILLAIAVPSLKYLYYGDRTHEPEMTLKVTGYQWYWGYEYPDHDGLTFLANMIPDAEIDKSKGQLRLLSTDNEVVLPVDTNIQILVTAADVLHAFAVPSLAVKMDAVPGRTNETWVRINKPGIYYGQCSELCGKNHGFMPIQIRAVTKEEFQQWLVTAKEEFASLSNEPQLIQLAQAEVTE